MRSAPLPPPSKKKKMKKKKKKKKKNKKKKKKKKTNNTRSGMFKRKWVYRNDRRGRAIISWLR